MSIEGSVKDFVLQTKVESVDANGNVTGTIGQYSYDGDGRRVKKIAYSNNQVTETTIFVYDASSRLVAEYSTIQNPTPQVAYLTTDHLGSPRINTNENGAEASRHDYRPYGEEITERTHAHYVGDTIRKQFTGYEREGETDLDFAQARTYSYQNGRFLSADEVFSDSDTYDGQSWNLYNYTRNRPLIVVDPTGERGTVTSTYDEKTNTTRITIRASFTLYGADGQNVSREELEKQRQALIEGIKRNWNGRTEFDGRNYEISVDVTAQVVGSEAEAIETGADNLVEVGADALFDTRDGERLVGQAYHNEGENFDRLSIALGDKPQFGYGWVYAHEFGHLLDARHTNLGLMANNGFFETEGLQTHDFRELFGSRKEVAYEGLAATKVGDKKLGTDLTRNAGSRILDSRIRNFEVRQVGAARYSVWRKP